MAKKIRASEAPTAAAPRETEGPVVLGDLLGTSRERRAGGGTRIELAEHPAADSPVVTVGRGSPPPGPFSRNRLLGVVLFALIAAGGVFVGLRSPTVGDALRTVSVVLVAAAVVIYLAAFGLWIRDRRRGLPAEPADVRAPASVPAAAPTAVPGTMPHVPTLAEVAAELDAATPGPAAASAAPAAHVPAVPPPPATDSARPQVTALAGAADPDPDADRDNDRDGELGHDVEVMDAIAPYTQVVGTPLIHERAASNGAVTPTAVVPAVLPAVVAVVPAVVAPVTPPPPPPPVRAVVPPPPPPRSVVPPPPPVPSPPPPARTAAEVFAAMAAAGPTDVPRAEPALMVEPVPLPIATVAPQAVAPQAVAPQAVAPQAVAPQAVAPTPAAPVVPPPPPGGRRPGRDDVIDLFGAQAAGGPLVPSADVPGWTPPSPVAAEGQALGHLPMADLTARSAVGSVAPVIVYRYRKWVLGQMMPGASFGPVDVDRSPDEWLLLATCGVATLLAWTHEDHHFTYSVETWAEEILPAHGVRIRDRELARDLILAAALHAGGVDSVPTERLRLYAPSDLVTAMASIHVGLLRLYCGLGRIGPERVLADQYGIGPGDIPLH